VKIAKFNAPIAGELILDQRGGELGVKYSRYVQLTEYADVEFIPLPAKEVVEGRLKQIDAAEQELREKFQQKLNELAEARAKLLSLTHEAQS
jgi:hypothetical protein